MPILRLAFTVAVATLTGCSSSPPKTAAERLLDDYRQSFHDAAGDAIVATLPRQQAIAELKQQRVIWIGDHHRHSRLHALHIELLEQLRRNGTPIALGLEALGLQDQRYVDAFLSRRIDMPQLQRYLRRRWSGSWLDDRELDPWYYRSLLEFGLRHELPVFAFEPTPRLPFAERDAAIVAGVDAALERFPDRVLVLVVGQSHLLGQGNVAGRCRAEGTVVGALPSQRLRAAADQPDRGHLLRSSGGVLWFAEMFR